MVLSSCKGDQEDQVLVAKYKEQQEIVKSLEKELQEVRAAINEVKIPEEIPDVKKMEAELRETIRKREALEAEMLTLRAQKKKATEDLETYKMKYPIR